MSTNECKTCKHYKPVHALDSRGDCTLYPAWLDVPEHHYCGQWAAGETVISETTATLDINWSQVPKGYDWVAQDSNGDIYAWATEPTIIETEEGYWRWRGDKDTHRYIGHTSIRRPRFRNNVTRRPGT
ncbi:MAG: hypothetical protein ACYCY2_03415 [Acidithiobacillus ferriphilus]